MHIHNELLYLIFLYYYYELAICMNIHLVIQMIVFRNTMIKYKS